MTTTPTQQQVHTTFHEFLYNKPTIIINNSTCIYRYLQLLIRLLFVLFVSLNMAQKAQPQKTAQPKFKDHPK